MSSGCDFLGVLPLAPTGRWKRSFAKIPHLVDKRGRADEAVSLIGKLYRLTGNTRMPS